jgi:hypothetical protein
VSGSNDDPDMLLPLRVEPHALRLARMCVAQVDRPSQELHEAVTLLTSELVAHAVPRSVPLLEESVQLRVWMPRESVRVEVQGPAHLLPAPSKDTELVLLLDQLANRWSVDEGVFESCAWFEIDRALPPSGVESGVAR